MRKAGFVSALALAFALTTSSPAQTVDPASDLGRFRDLRAAGMTALDNGDALGALTAFDQAQAILPDSPSIALLKAQVFLKQKRKPEARAMLAGYLKRGNVIDLAKNSDFNAVWDSGLEDQLQANQVPTGTMETIAGLNGLQIVEALAYAPDDKRFLLSAIHSGKIIAVSPEGVKEVLTFRPGVAAYGLALRDGTLWAATAQSRQTEGYDEKKPVASKIVALNPADGTILKAVSDTGQSDRHFGHLLAGRDDLYVADSAHGEVLRLTGYGDRFETLIPEGYMDSPQGLAESEDASVLMVSDFISGLYRIDLNAGSMGRLLPPADGNLLGITALSRYGNDLIAIQNGFRPNRILRLHMSADWSAVESVEVLLRSDKLLSQPSQGQVADDAFYFVAHSQWGELDDQGNAKSASVEPATVGVIQLAP